MINGEKINELLKKNKMEAQELAEKVGISPSMMSFIIRGLRNPSVSTMANIAQVFGCTVDDLLIK